MKLKTGDLVEVADDKLAKLRQAFSDCSPNNIGKVVGVKGVAVMVSFIIGNSRSPAVPYPIDRVKKLKK